MIHDHFGELQEELFVNDESAVLVNDPNLGTEGLYTFRVTGTKAKGTLKMVWVREVGDGALTVSAISITDECPLSHPLSLGENRKRSRLSSLVSPADPSGSRFEGLRPAPSLARVVNRDGLFGDLLSGQDIEDRSWLSACWISSTVRPSV